MATKRTSIVCCTLCYASSVAICVACDCHFCWDHFCEHRRTFDKYIDNVYNHRQPPLECFVELKQLENKLQLGIDNWERNKIADVHRAANEAKKVLETHINNYRFRFEEELSTLIDTESTNRYTQSIQIEKLQIEYNRALKNIRLVPYNDERLMLEIEITNPTREEISLKDSSSIVPRQCGIYEPQTILGKRLIKEPFKVIPVGSYWTIGGSDEYLLVQEYEINQLTLFDRHGTRYISIHTDS